MPDNSPLDILAIAAHPDDVEITCAGFMIRMSDRGRLTGVLDLTRGEMGTLGDERDRAAEADAAAHVMGLAVRYNLGLPDAGVEFTHENKLKIAGAIRAARPEMVVLPHWEQRHAEHLACSRVAYEGCFLAGLKKLDLPGEPFRPRKIAYASYFRNTDYSYLVDISEAMDRKLEAVACYRSQFANKVTAKHIFQPGLDINELIQVRAAQLGQLVGVRYAEAFTIKENILIDDPQKMPVQSL